MMNRTIAAAAAGLIAAGGTLTLSSAQAATDEPDLSCKTVQDCQVLLGRMYSELVDVSAEATDLRKINARQARKIERQQRTIERLRDR